ncbi:diguanylate cyclase domain-containing protein [Aliivibrio wodanis]|uniref:diguanylate cyclase domain-containing protein n=1 Tax=Aliivibrio wodanis TaxID=80852 RepID=UPI00406C710A
MRPNWRRSEFVLYFSSSKEIPTVELLIEQLRHEIGLPLTVNDLPLSISASIGVAQYPIDGKNTDSLLQYADNNMYLNKHS